MSTQASHPSPAGILADRRDRPDTASAVASSLARWMGFLAGLALLAALTLLNPSEDLDVMRRERDRVLQMEQTALERIGNHRRFLEAVNTRDPDTMSLLFASQLQLVPANRAALVVPGAAPSDPQVFELLEPMPVPMAVNPPEKHSMLARIASSDVGRLVLVVLAAGAIAWGLRPGRPSRL